MSKIPEGTTLLARRGDITIFLKEVGHGQFQKWCVNYEKFEDVPQFIQAIIIGSAEELTHHVATTLPAWHGLSPNEMVETNPQAYADFIQDRVNNVDMWFENAAGNKLIKVNSVHAPTCSFKYYAVHPMAAKLNREVTRLEDEIAKRTSELAEVKKSIKRL